MRCLKGKGCNCREKFKCEAGIKNIPCGLMFTSSFVSE